MLAWSCENYDGIVIDIRWKRTNRRGGPVMLQGNGIEFDDFVFSRCRGCTALRTSN